MLDKDTNPKDAIANNKLPYHFVPSTLRTFAALSFMEGATKYGAYNWRVKGVRASVYYDALQRHLEKWWNGEPVDPATGVPHLSSALACIGIILDADVCGKLTDDRPPVAPMAGLIDVMEPIIANLRELNKDKNPKHYTIKDSQVDAPRNEQPRPEEEETGEKAEPYRYGLTDTKGPPEGESRWQESRTYDSMAERGLL